MSLAQKTHSGHLESYRDKIADRKVVNIVHRMQGLRIFVFFFFFFFFW